MNAAVDFIARAGGCVEGELGGVGGGDFAGKMCGLGCGLGEGGLIF